ncbi:MAG: UbiX family flavin prenyltransferase [Candidatus Methylomirabilia bacterium]
MTASRRIVVGITGATGAIYGVRLLELLQTIPEAEVHLVISRPGKRIIVEETDYAVKDVEALAHRVYDNQDIGAALASGSFKTDGMVIAPCSIRTASAVAHCRSDTLVARAADVTLKEGRSLVLLVREAPLHVGHLRCLLALAEMGAVLLPPMPAFYHRPKQIDDLILHTLARALDRLRLPHRLVEEWQGTHPRVAPLDRPGL